MQRMIRGISKLPINSCFKRSLSTAITYSAYGKPSEILKVTDIPSVAKQLNDNEVELKILAAPINPADINMIEGVYGIKAKFPAIAGGEGVAEVKKVGSKVSGLAPGDWVIPASAASAFGTWRTEAITDASLLQKIDNDIPVPYAATLGVNPCTAYRMLKDFVQLKPGDVIIQNGANSMVGLAVLQLAREWGIKTINIIRSDRPRVDQTLKLLGGFGGDINVTDDMVNTETFREILADLPPIKLALNCVGGEVATDMARCLANGATMVTYGGMSKRPLTLPFELFNYKQLNLRGFWVSKWHSEHTAAERSVMLNEICKLIRENKLSFLFELHDFDDFHHALKTSLEPFRFRKIVLNMDHPDRLEEHDKRHPSDYFIFETTVV